MYDRKVEACSPNYICHGKSCITYSECVCVCLRVALGIRQAVRLRLLYCHLWACLALQYFLFHIIS